MNKRKIIIKNINKNLYKRLIEILKATSEILKAPFELILDKLKELSHE